MLFTGICNEVAKVCRREIYEGYKTEKLLQTWKNFTQESKPKMVGHVGKVKGQGREGKAFLGFFLPFS